ncbi:hypothetical protein V6R21_17390 [Limibacter armeniacum]|uniref:hypothetical protein n=1 Tax=Limibacter armeniacum TaxID=466084 RepID=UPI002FE56D6F
MYKKNAEVVTELLSTLLQDSQNTDQQEFISNAARVLDKTRAELLAKIIYQQEEDIINMLFKKVEEKFHQKVKEGVQQSIVNYVEKYFPSDALLQTRTYLDGYINRIEKLERSVSEGGVGGGHHHNSNALRHYDDEVRALKDELLSVNQQLNKRYFTLQDEIENVREDLMRELQDCRREAMIIQQRQREMNEQGRSEVNTYNIDGRLERLEQQIRNIGQRSYQSESFPVKEGRQYQENDLPEKPVNHTDKKVASAVTGEGDGGEVDMQSFLGDLQLEYVKASVTDYFYAKGEEGFLTELCRHDKGLAFQYRVTLLDEDRAEFELINHPVKLHQANMNKDEKLDPYTVVVGTASPSTKVEVVSRGFARKSENETWKVERKCRFEYR